MKVILWERKADVDFVNDVDVVDITQIGRTEFYAWLAETEEGQWVRKNFKQHTFKVDASVNHNTYQHQVRVYIESEPSATLTAYLLRFRHSA